MPIIECFLQNGFVIRWHFPDHEIVPGGEQSSEDFEFLDRPALEHGKEVLDFASRSDLIDFDRCWTQQLGTGFRSNVSSVDIEAKNVMNEENNFILG